MYVVTIFVVAGCRFCDDAKSALYALQMQQASRFRVVEADATPSVRERLAKATGCRTLPSVWLDAVYIGGLNTGPHPFGGLTRVIANDLWHVARR